MRRWSRVYERNSVVGFKTIDKLFAENWGTFFFFLFDISVAFGNETDAILYDYTPSVLRSRFLEFHAALNNNV